MNSRTEFAGALRCAACTMLVLALLGQAQAHVYWRNRQTGDNAMWFMTPGSTNLVGSTAITPLLDLDWEVVGHGDFNYDGVDDLLWRHKTLLLTAVWFLNSSGSKIGDSLLLNAPPTTADWQIRAVGHFGKDAGPAQVDIVWRHRTTGSNAIWYMDGVNFRNSQMIESLADLDWDIVATGEFNGDGKTDLVWRHRVFGYNALWYMNLPNPSDNANKIGSANLPALWDVDWGIVDTAHFDGNGTVDLQWRHTTLGLNAVWYMSGATVSTGVLFAPEYNTDWRMSRQDYAESYWRLQRGASQHPSLSATVSASPPQITLNFSIPKPDSSYLGITIHRRLWSEANWSDSNWGPPLVNNQEISSYVDTTVSVGQRYEYRVYRPWQFGATTPYYITAAINAAPIESRGRLILVVDETLVTALADRMATLQQDLVADGWEVIRINAPRHDDGVWANNPARIATVKSNLVGIYNQAPANTKAIYIVGHVAVPYSGSLASDGHAVCQNEPYYSDGKPQHSGAWCADVYYADVDGAWTDTNVNFLNCDFPQASNVPGDGKFDTDHLAGPPTIEMAIGRVDFAKLPAFGVQPPPPSGVDPQEVAMLGRYLDKAHAYRHKQLAWQQSPTAVHERVIVYDHFLDKYPTSTTSLPYQYAIKTASALYGSAEGKVTVGNPLLNRFKPAVWAFPAGPGKWDKINDAVPHLEVTTPGLSTSSPEPKALFYAVRASFLGDWNLVTNSFLRSLLIAGSEYGLAAMWYNLTSPWRAQEMALGSDLGGTLRHLMNNATPQSGYYDRRRDLSIQGDPTLRLHVLAPPTSVNGVVSGSVVTLSWTAGESGCQYYVYRAAASNGPFTTRISPQPITGTSFLAAGHSAGQVYLVRALKTVSNASGSYTNISQGTRWP